jgi:hypothetical protein
MCTIDVSHARVTVPPVSHEESPGTRYLLAVAYAIVLVAYEAHPIMKDHAWTLAASECEPHHGAYEDDGECSGALALYTRSVVAYTLRPPR